MEDLRADAPQSQSDNFGHQEGGLGQQSSSHIPNPNLSTPLLGTITLGIRDLVEVRVVMPGKHAATLGRMADEAGRQVVGFCLNRIIQKLVFRGKEISPGRGGRPGKKRMEEGESAFRDERVGNKTCGVQRLGGVLR